MFAGSSLRSQTMYEGDIMLLTALIYWRKGRDISVFPFWCIEVAGIDPGAVAAAHFLFGSFTLDDSGRRRVQEIVGSMFTLTGQRLPNKRMKDRVQLIASHRGYMMLVMCGSLMELYGIDFAAEVLGQMHGDVNGLSASQWKLLLQPFTGLRPILLTASHSRLCRLAASQVSSPASNPKGVAAALVALRQLSRGERFSIGGTGGALVDICFIAVLGEWLLDLSIKITDPRGELIYSNQNNTDSVRGSFIQLFLIFDPEQPLLGIKKDVPFKRDTTVMEGRGSFGIVYRATDTLNQVFAVKRLDKVYGESKKAVVYKEFELLRQCSHPNLLQLIPWAPDTLHDFINLDDHQRESMFPWYQKDDKDDTKLDLYVYNILYGLADGLSYLHQTGIKHKDIKPGNLLLFREQKPDPTKRSNPWGVRPIIADLGVSKLFKPDSSTNFTHSTYDYLAPEQVHHVESTPKSDVFAMGCCFANILVILCQGSRGRESLLDAITGESRSCQYARELDHVKVAMEQICFGSGGKRPSRKL
ncbi:MAG: hypothetical protein Q9187_005384 [Circinaria calcarea]